MSDEYSGWKRVPVASIPQDHSYPCFIIPGIKKVHYPDKIVILTAGDSEAQVLHKPTQYGDFLLATQKKPSRRARKAKRRRV